jgi:uracil-DNA glycosylase family 4
MAKIAIIGEALGAEEQSQGQYFVGPTGQKVLWPCLASARLVRSDLLVLNVVRERPPDNDITRFVDVSTGRTTPEYETYKEMLFEDLARHPNINVILAMGRVPTFALLGRSDSISSLRGNVWKREIHGKTRLIIPTNHPTTVLRPGKAFHSLSSYGIRHLLTGYFRKAKWLANMSDKEREALTSFTLDINPELSKIIRYIQKLIKNKKPFAYDIEVLNEEISHISISDKPDYAMSIPLYERTGHLWNKEDETTIWTWVSRLIASPNPRVAHNLVFETVYMFTKMNIIPHDTAKTYDTMVAMAINNTDYGRSLEITTSEHDTIPFYKSDGGKRHSGEGIGQDAFRRYNAFDSLTLFRSAPSIVKSLNELDNLPAFERQTALVNIAAYISVRGIRVDLKLRDKLKDQFLAREEQAEKTIRDLKAPVDNIRSRDQWMSYFYNTLKFGPYKNKEGEITLDKIALQRIIRKAENSVPGQIAQALYEYRVTNKMRRTYFECKLSPEGRFMTSINPVGGGGSRFSSSKSIMGEGIDKEGMNSQNQPGEFKEILIPDPDHIMYCCDLDKADARTYAYCGPEKRMMEIFNQNLNIYKELGKEIFGNPITKEPGTSVFSPGTQRTSYQDAKMTALAFLYGRKAESFSLQNMIPLKQAKEIYYKITCLILRDIPTITDVIQRRIRSTGTLTNCFGKTRRFSDRLWGIDTLNLALSWNPASTTADLINQRNMRYLYEISEADILGQRHDESIFQLPKSIGLDRHVEILWGLKQSVEQDIHPVKFFPSSKQLPPYKIPLGIAAGYNMNAPEIDSSSRSVLKNALTPIFNQPWS